MATIERPRGSRLTADQILEELRRRRIDLRGLVMRRSNIAPDKPQPDRNDALLLKLLRGD
jgi:hypothetical protein